MYSRRSALAKTLQPVVAGAAGWWVCTTFAANNYLGASGIWSVAATAEAVLVAVYVAAVLFNRVRRLAGRKGASLR